MKKAIILSICIISAMACTKEKFTGTHSFWYNKQTAEDLLAYGITSLTLYIDDNQLETINAYDHFTVDPGCGNGNFVYTNSMFKRENETHVYKIKDQTDSLIWQGTFMMSQKTPCDATTLVLSF
ncbi:hypothetical protein D3C87_98020 [compost metagenome]